MARHALNPDGTEPPVRRIGLYRSEAAADPQLLSGAPAAWRMLVVGEVLLLVDIDEVHTLAKGGGEPTLLLEVQSPELLVGFGPEGVLTRSRASSGEPGNEDLWLTRLDGTRSKLVANHDRFTGHATPDGRGGWLVPRTSVFRDGLLRPTLERLTANGEFVDVGCLPRPDAFWGDFRDQLLVVGDTVYAVLARQDDYRSAQVVRIPLPSR